MSDYTFLMAASGLAIGMFFGYIVPMLWDKFQNWREDRKL